MVGYGKAVFQNSEARALGLGVAEIRCYRLYALRVSQVVAGVNYCIRFSASANCSVHHCQVGRYILDKDG